MHNSDYNVKDALYEMFISLSWCVMMEFGTDMLYEQLYTPDSYKVVSVTQLQNTASSTKIL